MCTELIELLQELESSNIVLDKFDDSNIINPNKLEDNHIIKRIESLADEYLITDTGSCNWSNMRLLKNKGFRVGPGEQDSFGWLTGIIYTKKGQIVFG